MRQWSNLVPVALTPILGFLTKHRDLHACALVNRHWHIYAIPRLWREPFSRVYKSPRATTKIIQLLLSFLKPTELLSLKVPEHRYCAKRPPSWDYPSLICVLDCADLRMALFHWKYISGPMHNATSCADVRTALTRLIYQHVKRLDTIKLVGIEVPGGSVDYVGVLIDEISSTGKDLKTPLTWLRRLDVRGNLNGFLGAHHFFAMCLH